MIYEMIAGERPFKAKSALEMVQLQIRQTPPSLAEKVPGTSPTVAAVVAKMLAKKPADRFPDVQSAYQALHDAYHPVR
jgi:serine/threonine protein kinase